MQSGWRLWSQAGGLGFVISPRWGFMQLSLFHLVQTVRSQFSHRLFSPALPQFLKSVLGSEKSRLSGSRQRYLRLFRENFKRGLDFGGFGDHRAHRAVLGFREVNGGPHSFRIDLARADGV